MKALGFIETKGLTGNIEATDALLKAANVEFLGSNTGIGSGLTTVVVTGDVGRWRPPWRRPRPPPPRWASSSAPT